VRKNATRDRLGRFAYVDFGRARGVACRCGWCVGLAPFNRTATHRASRGPARFASFIARVRQWLSNGISRQRPGLDRRWRSPGSRAKGFCACQGLRRRGVGMCLAISTPAVLPSVGRKTSAPRTCLTPLNTSLPPSPVNGSRLPSRATRASLGASAVRYSFTVTDFHRLPFAGLPAHPSTTSKSRRLNFATRSFSVGHHGDAT
jgi:hypothetical protein